MENLHFAIMFASLETSDLIQAKTPVELCSFSGIVHKSNQELEQVKNSNLFKKLLHWILYTRRHSQYVSRQFLPDLIIMKSQIHERSLRADLCHNDNIGWC